MAVTDHREDLSLTLKKQIEGIKYGVNIVIVRGYDRFSDIQKICNGLKVLKEQYDFQLIINAYPTKEFLNLKPDGFHLNVKNMKKVINNRINLHDFGKIGVSVHNEEEIKLSQMVSPDYVLISPIFQPSCKSTVKTLGITGLENMIHHFYEIYEAENKMIPKFIALGGIDKNNCKEIFDNYELDGIAIMSAIQEIKHIS